MIECDTDKKYHRNHGQLGFALKDRQPPDWTRAEKELSTAIEMRDRLLDACAALRGSGRLLGGVGSIESTSGDVVRPSG